VYHPGFVTCEKHRGKVSSFLSSSSRFWYKHMPMIPLVSGQPKHKHPWEPPNFQVPS